jgi:DNA-binding MarR family transcriptional regulator
MYGVGDPRTANGIIIGVIMDDAPQAFGSAANCLELLEDLSRLTRTLRTTLAEVVQPNGLTDTELQLLYRCASSSDGLAQRQLADALAISTAAVSGLVEGLRRRGLIACHRPADDRRRQVWKLTARGHQLLGQLMSTLGPRLELLLAASAPSSLATLRQTARGLQATAASTPAPRHVQSDVMVKRGAA